MHRSFTEADRAFFKLDDDDFYDEPELFSNPFTKEHFREHWLIHAGVYAFFILVIIAIAVPLKLKFAKSAGDAAIVPVEFEQPAIIQSTSSIPVSISATIATSSTSARATSTLKTFRSTSIATTRTSAPSSMTTTRVTISRTMMLPSATSSIISTKTRTSIKNARPTPTTTFNDLEKMSDVVSASNKIKSASPAPDPKFVLAVLEKQKSENH